MKRAEIFLAADLNLARQDTLTGMGSQTQFDVFRKSVG